MNFKKISLIIYTLIAIFIVLNEYNVFSVKKQVAVPKPILRFDTTLLDAYMKKYDENLPLNPYWGFKEVKTVKIDDNKTKKPTTQEIQIKQVKNKNILCIDSSCYRLVAIHYDKNKPFVTLYNKKFKKKLQDYTIFDKLEANVSIKNITTKSVVFADQNDTKSWKFQLFDVNATKYKPKDINETDF